MLERLHRVRARGPGRHATLTALPFVGEYALGPVALKLEVAGALTLCVLPVLLTLHSADLQVADG